MALYDTITIAGGGKVYPINVIEVNDETDLKVKKEGATTNLSTDDYTISGSQITFDTGYTVTDGDKYIIYRDTKDDAARNNFYPSGSVRAQDLNKNFEQAFMAVEDKVPQFGATFPDNVDMGGNRITGLKDIYSSVDTNEDISSMFTDSDAASIGFVKHFFFDSGAETILQGEDWPIDSNTKIATTKAVDYRVDEKLQTALNEKVLADPASGITITDGASVAGQVNPITLGLADGGIEIEKINTSDINTAAETVYSSQNNVPQATTDWVNTDDQIATLAAIAKRHDGYVQQDAPSGTDYLPGTIWLSEQGSSEGAAVQTVNEFGEKLNKYFAIWNGTEWIGVAGGGTWINQNRLIWVDAGNGDDSNDGHRVIAPMKTIQGAVNTADDGDMIFVQPGIYSEYLPIDLGRKKNVSIIGLSMRSVFVHPDPSNRWVVGTAQDVQVSNKVMTNGPHGGYDNSTSSEYETMFKLGSGSFVANMTISGMKASGTRTDLATGANSSEATNQGWFFAFSENDGQGNGVRFTKSPYIQNVTCFADAGIDNNNFQPHITNLNPQDKGFAGDKSSGMTGGALLVDGNVPHADSPLRSFLTDAYTIICLDGPGVLVRNEGYAQLVSTFGHFTHYHAKAESGSMINMSNCTTDFGRFGLIADGQSTNAIFEGTVTAEHNDAKIVHVVSTENPTVAWSARGSLVPVNHMVLEYDGQFYPIKAVTNNSTSGYDVELYEGFTIAAGSATVYFHLQSIITTGGHVFEFAGAGTDYRAHPDNGGQPVPDNQIKKVGSGAVYISSTDHNGNFKVGDVFHVSSDGASADVTGTLNVTGNINVSDTIDAATVKINGTETKGSSTFFDANDDIKNSSLPDISGLPTTAQAYPSSVTLDAKGRVTTISSGTEPVTAVNVTSPITGDSTSKTPTIGVKEFGGTDDAGATILKGVVSAQSSDSSKFLKGDGTWSNVPTFSGSSQTGVVANDNSSTNDTKFLRGDGSWADPAQAAYSLSSSESGTEDINLNLTGSSTSTVKLIKGTGIVFDHDPNGTGTDQEVKISAPSSANAQVYTSSSVPANPLAGDTWWDTNTGECYLYYTDADSSQWVQFAPQQRGTGNGTVTSIQVTGGTGLSVNNASAVTASGSYQISLDNTAVTAGTYGDAGNVAKITVDAQGRITSAADVEIIPPFTVTLDSLHSITVPAVAEANPGPATVTCGLGIFEEKEVRVGDLVTIANFTDGSLPVDLRALLNSTHRVTAVDPNAGNNGEFDFVVGDSTYYGSQRSVINPNGTVTLELNKLYAPDDVIGVFPSSSIPELPSSRITTGTFGPLRIDRTQSLAISKIFVPVGTSDGATPPVYSGPVTVECDLANADSLLEVGDRVTIAGNTGNHANNQSFLNATHTITEVVAEATVGNVTTPAHFKFVIADGVGGLHSADDTATENLGTCTWIDKGLIETDRIPNLNAAKLTSGTVNEQRLPTDISKSKIARTNRWATTDIPRLNGDGTEEFTYLEKLVDDSKPKLGSNLDVNSHKIVSVNNQNITLDPDGTGKVVVNNTWDNSINTYSPSIAADSTGNRLAGTYDLENFSGDQDGRGAGFTVVVAANGDATITKTEGGTNFIVGETIAIPASQTGGGDSITITVSSINTDHRSGQVALQELPAADADAHEVVIKAPTLESSYTLTLPTDDGNANQLLKTNGSGVLSWVDDADTTYTATSWRSSEATRTAGLVPATAGSGDATKYLAGNGTWTTLPAVSTFDSGMIMWWPGRGVNIPSGWIPCDGRVYQYATRVDDGQGNITTTYLNEANTNISLQHLRDALATSSTESGGCIYDSQRDPDSNTISRPAADWTAGNVANIDPLNLPTFDVLEHFAVPDLRGEFIRGWDNGRQVDEDHATRDLGSAQEDQFQEHKHSRGGTTTGTFGGNAQSNVYSGPGQNGASINGYVTIEGASDFDATNPHRSGDETRPRNLAMIAIIKL